MKKSLLLLALVAPVLSGCDVATRIATRAVLKKFAPVSAASGADAAYVSGLTPVPSGDGLIVFEPQIAASSAKWAGLGDGCSRYLQVYVAGQSALGKTPLWGTVDDLSVELKQPDLRPGAAKARQIGLAAGVTRVAIGHLSGGPGALTLGYQLLDVASGKVLGSVQTSASPAQMPAALPLLARQMSAGLGIARPVLPARATLSSEELAFLGSQHWKLRYGDTISPAAQNRVQSLAPKDALAGILAQRLCNFEDDANWQKIGDDLLRQAPDNALVVAEVSWEGCGRFMKHPAPLEAFARKYPRNYLICTAKMRFERGSKARALEVKWAENAVRASPGNAMSWIQLAQAQGFTAQDLRYARTSSQISSAEWQRLNAIYPKAHAAALRATQVDPSNAYAWSQLAEAATFNDNYAAAQSALWKSLALDPGNFYAYDWGFEMCQPKWGGDGASVLKLAQFAAANADKTSINARSIVLACNNSNQRGALRPILQTILVKDPRNASAMAELGSLFQYEDHLPARAERLYRQALQIQPDLARANSGLADATYYFRHNPALAEPLYRKAMAEDPKNGYYHANFGRFLALNGRRVEAISQANQAKSLGFNDPTHKVWEATGVSP